MILLDTSIWIRLLSKDSQPVFPKERLNEVVLCAPIIQEILQGIRNDLAFKRIKEDLLAFPLLAENVPPSELAIEAAQLYRFARAKGKTIRSSMDCLIAAIAIRHQVTLLHCDRDYDLIAEISPLRAERI